MDTVTCYCGNIFQVSTNLKMQTDAISSRDSGIRINAEDMLMIMDYIGQMPCETRYIYENKTNPNIKGMNYYVNYETGKNNFIEYWLKELGLSYADMGILNSIWDNAIISNSDYNLKLKPIVIVGTRGVMTIESFVNAMYCVFSFKS